MSTSTVIKTTNPQFPTDLFGRVPISEDLPLFETKNITSDNETTWETILTGAILLIGTVVGPGFQIGEVITDGTVFGTITDVQSGYLVYTNTVNYTLQGAGTVPYKNSWAGTVTGQITASTAPIISSNTGAHYEYNYNKSEVKLQVGILQGQKVTRQTYRYLPYFSAFAQKIFHTFDLELKDGVTQRILYGDDLNAIGFILNGKTPQVMIRSNTSGSPEATIIPNYTAGDTDNSWNINTCTNIDFSKNQITGIQFQWLGVGEVILAINLSGKIIPVHRFDHANVTEGIYMRTPTLPVRYEIENTGIPTSPTIMNQICCAVISAGGRQLPGVEFSEGLEFGEEVTISDTIFHPIFAIRLKNEFPTSGKPNRKTIKLLNVQYFARDNDITFRLGHLHDPTSITGTWTPYDDSSAVEYSKNISAVSAKHIHWVDKASNVFSGGNKYGSERTKTFEFISNHSFLSQNINSDNSQIFVVYAKGRILTPDAPKASCQISWIEFE